MKPNGKDNPLFAITKLPRLNPVTIKNNGDEPAILFNLPRKPAYPSGTTISDPLVYNSNESEPDPLEQPG